MWEEAGSQLFWDERRGILASTSNTVGDVDRLPVGNVPKVELKVADD